MASDDEQSLAGYASTHPEADRDLLRLEREIERLRLERDSAKAAHRQAERENADLGARLEMLARIDDVSVESAPWARPGAARRRREATALVMLSDLHLDEIVNPAEVSGLNAFDREIALGRLERTAEGAIRLGTELMSGFEYSGCVVVLGGDLVSGNIHEELRETNETTSMIATVDYWVDPIASFLETISSAYGRCHVVSVVGNHGRLTRKPRAKGRVEDNFDYLLARLLQRHYRSDERFTWNIPLSADAYVDVYDSRLLITHGDQARGGSGISGLLTPVSLLDHRKRKRDATTGRTYDHLLMGHWHTYLRTGTVTVNGSLKGTDEYAFLSNFGHEEPSQAFAVITPEHGVTIEAAIYCADRESEGW